MLMLPPARDEQDGLCGALPPFMPALNRIPLRLITFWIARPGTGRVCLVSRPPGPAFAERLVCQVPASEPPAFLAKPCAKALRLHLLSTWGKNTLIRSTVLQKQPKGLGLFAKQILWQGAAQHERFSVFIFCRFLFICFLFVCFNARYS